MNRGMVRLFALGLSTVIVGIYQALHLFPLSVNPNLTLVFVISASFFLREREEFFLLPLLGAFILKSSPGFEEESLVFFLIGSLAGLVKNFLPLQNFLSNLLFIALGTFFFYLILAREFLLSMMFWEELFFNLILGIGFFALLSWLWQNKGA